jgi:hypothetical protein
MMNQRIEEFAKQCYVKTGSPHTDHFEYWKFAELIVRECADLFDKDEIELSYTMRTIHNTIKEHFGVEVSGDSRQECLDKWHRRV